MKQAVALLGISHARCYEWREGNGGRKGILLYMGLLRFVFPLNSAFTGWENGWEIFVRTCIEHPWQNFICINKKVFAVMLLLCINQVHCWCAVDISCQYLSFLETVFHYLSVKARIAAVICGGPFLPSSDYAKRSHRLHRCCRHWCPYHSLLPLPSPPPPQPPFLLMPLMYDCCFFIVRGRAVTVTIVISTATYYPSINNCRVS